MPVAFQAGFTFIEYSIVPLSGLGALTENLPSLPELVLDTNSFEDALNNSIHAFSTTAPDGSRTTADKFGADN